VGLRTCYNALSCAALTDARLWYAFIFGYCLAVSLLVRKANKEKGINFYKGAALSCLMGYGGGTLCPILCGIPGVLVQNEVAVPMMVFAWSLSSLGAVEAFLLRNPIGLAILSTTFEVFRCQVMMGCAAMAVANLQPPKSYPVATVGPLICGMLGGIGGGFMPLSVGLEPLNNGPNWRISSAFCFSVWMRVLMDPNTQPYLVALEPGLADATAGRALGVAVVAMLPLLATIVPLPLGMNPLFPAKVKTA